MPGNAEVRPGKYRMGVMVERPYKSLAVKLPGFIFCHQHPNYMFYQITTWITIALFVIVLSFSTGYLAGCAYMKFKSSKNKKP